MSVLIECNSCHKLQSVPFPVNDYHCPSCGSKLKHAGLSEIIVFFPGQSHPVSYEFGATLGGILNDQSKSAMVILIHMVVAALRIKKLCLIQDIIIINHIPQLVKTSCFQRRPVNYPT